MSEQVDALLHQLAGIVRAEGTEEEQLQRVQALLVQADELIGRGNQSPALVRLEALLNKVQPRVSMAEAQRYPVPISIVHQVDDEPVTLEIMPPQGGHLELGGICCRNDPFQIRLLRMTLGNQLILEDVEPNIYNTCFPYVPVEIGTISRTRALLLTVGCMWTPSVLPYLNLTFFGREVEGP